MPRVLTLLICSLCALTAAELRLASCLGDGAVLQREQPVPIWGWADPGTAVTVAFAGQSVQATADGDGRWQAQLGAMDAASNGRNLVVSAGGVQLTKTDVVVGDVWLCSGQSNMAFSLKQLGGKIKGDGSYQVLADAINADIADTNDPLLRMMVNPNAASPQRELDELSNPSAIVWLKADNPKNTTRFTGTGFYFGRALRREIDVPIGLIASAHSGTLVEPWIPLAAVRTLSDLSELHDSKLADAIKTAETMTVITKADYKAAMAKWKKDGKKGPEPQRPTQDPLKSPRMVSTLYNARISPLTPMALSGVIWYQGESNTAVADNARLYHQRFSAMIEGWRAAFGRPDLPFYFVQLAGARSAETKPDEQSTWAIVRDQQRRTLALADTGMALALDIGQSEDIHPRNKRELGERLALWARHHHYGQADVVPSGPLYRSHSIANGAVTITFDHCADGLRTGTYGITGPVAFADTAPGAFEIRGADGTWHQATVTINGKDTITVSNPAVTSPSHVRYGWTEFAPQANLYNSAGSPATPFITD
ncbi:MAG: sialate O-acetylesterase [Planctomycetota bacterium]|jgi:sialate O-acetylesterase